MSYPSLKHKAVLVLVSIFLTLGLSEFIVRIFKLAPPMVKYYGCFRLVENEKIVYEFIPGAKVDQSIINQQGFKDSNFVLAKEKNLTRIAMLGDSITQGMFVSLGKTFSDVLEFLLNKSAIEQHRNNKYEVMNFGVSGYNLEAEIETLKTKVIKYAPDIVILNYYYNDDDSIPGYHMFVIDRNIQLNKAQRLSIIRKYYSSPNPIMTFIRKSCLNQSKLCIFLWDRLNRVRLGEINLEAIFRKHYGELMERREIAMMFQHLKELKEISQKYHFDILICIHSFLLQGENPNNALFAKIAQKAGSPYFHMFPYYKKYLSDSNKSLSIGFDHCHLNELGHRIIAGAISEELKRNRLIK